MDMIPVISFKDFSFQYDSASTLSVSNINLGIKEGETVLITGRSGCGKTTLLRAMNGLIPHFFEGKIAGDVKVFDRDVRHEQLHNLSFYIGTVFQDPRSQFFTTNTTSEIAFGMENIGLERSEMLQRIEKISRELQIENLRDCSVFGLSSGEKQKIALASVYGLQPKIFLFDEPSANLDEASINRLTVLMKKIKEKGHTIIIVEHRLHYLMPIIDRVIYMNEGKIEGDFTKKAFLGISPQQLEQMGLRMPELNLSDRIQRFNEITDNIPSPGESSNPIGGSDKQSVQRLVVNNLTIDINNKNILKNVSFGVDKGEIIGIVGENGSGKTTLLKAICGLLKEKKGSIHINGNKSIGARERLKDTYYVMQDSDYQLFTDTTENELILGNDNGKNDNQKNLKDRIELVMKELDILKYKQTHPAYLSRGEKQRVTIAVGAISNKDIILLDEPTSGLDLASMTRVSDILHDLKKKGKTILVITHDYEFIMKTCCRILYLHKGKVTDTKNISMQ